MKSKKFSAILIVAALTVASVKVDAQHYDTSLGLRLGYQSGVTFKYFLMPANGMEAMVTFSPEASLVHGLYVYQANISGAPDVDWYCGIGLHIGGIYKKDYSEGRFMFGGDIMTGIEYHFTTIPFTISLDWKPDINFIGSFNNHWYYPFALSFRHRF